MSIMYDAIKHAAKDNEEGFECEYFISAAESPAILFSMKTLNILVNFKFFGTNTLLKRDLKPINITKVSEAIGAEIDGVDLSKPIDAKTITEIRRYFGSLCYIFPQSDFNGRRLNAGRSIFRRVASITTTSAISRDVS